MEELIKRLQETVGLSSEDATKSVATLMEFVKEKLPVGLGDKVAGLMNGQLDLGSLFGGSSAAAPVNPMDKLKDMFQ